MYKGLAFHGLPARPNFLVREVMPVLLVGLLCVLMFAAIVSGLRREPAWHQQSYPGYSLSEMLFQSPAARDMMQ